MDILKNIKLKVNDTILNNQTDYIRYYFIDYFGYQYDSDINVYLEPLTAEVNEYTIFLRYRNMIEDKPNIDSGYLKYIWLTEKRSSYGMKYSSAKSLLMYSNGWKSLGMYFTDECKQRFKLNNKKEFDFINGLLKYNIDITPYKVNYKPIIDYIILTLEIPEISKYSFNSKGITRKKWYAIEDKTNPNSKYKVNIYDKTGLYIKTITDIIPKGYYYRFINN